MFHENSIDRTIWTYQEHFDTYTRYIPRSVEGALKEWRDIFCSYLPCSAYILELGSATERDATYLSNKGHRVLCTDVVPQALERLKIYGFETETYDARDIPPRKWRRKFDAIFANAVFHHFPPNQMLQSLANLSVILKKEGIFAVTVKAGREEEKISYCKLNAPRYFYYYSELKIRQIIETSPYTLLHVSYTHDQFWLRFMLRRDSP